ncbi:squalene/phytoene synthase family protein [Mesobacterium sp. TK19101]|uniref:Squalene/phytoene synthase family protein n=1 Tax=Mesobacterium hydrothermale TaxID=3111907 RepID=A0ABU6HK81_9RHOB|nr:squalene/phytoene synthase family protein [Mesobacterium sp. TK19101]MEC3862314.1 squalene/phytoene synthase family protein [Mesobacterium sp. TK19101]
MSVTFDSDLTACAALVERGDPERFAAAMAAPVAARAVLFPIYAFNVEVARAPWVTSEPLIAQMRLQWWADALEEIASGGPVRRHEVVTPLARVLTPAAVVSLSMLVDARRLDVERAPFASEEALLRYLSETAGSLAEAAAQSLGAPSQAMEGLARWGQAAGLARYLRAVPALKALGRKPLPPGADVIRLVQICLDEIPSWRAMACRLGPGRAAALELWQAQPVLRQAVWNPARVDDGRLGLSPFSAKWRLLLAAL